MWGSPAFGLSAASPPTGRCIGKPGAERDLPRSINRLGGFNREGVLVGGFERTTGRLAKAGLAADSPNAGLPHTWVFLNPDRQPKGSTRPIFCVEREYGIRIGA